MATASTPAPVSSQETVDAKIVQDLEEVSEKMDLLDGLLKSRDNQEALLGAIGYLEACAPRMVELVEAAAQGALSESVLMKCLEVNDRLTKQLEDLDDSVAPMKTHDTPPVSASAETATTAPPSAAAAAPPPEEGQMVDLLLDDESDDAGGGTKSTDAAADSNQKPAATASGADDGFDDFFNERANSSNSDLLEE